MDILAKLRLPIATKKEVNGQLYYIKLAGLNSEVWVKSADRPESCVGEGVDVLVLEEAAKIRKIVWEQYLRPTLADRQGWALFTTTPEGYNWIYDLWQRGKSEEFKDWHSWQHPSWESPFFKDDIEELKQTLTYETFQQEFGAQFTAFQGGCFHLIAPYTSKASSLTQIFLPMWESTLDTAPVQQDGFRLIPGRVKIKYT